MKILIVSYYAFPLNAVASYRIESFCEGFTKQGADVTLLTRHWDKTFKTWNDILSSNDKEAEVRFEKGYRKIYLPFKEKKPDSKYRLVSTLITFKSYLFGNLQPESNTYRNFKEYALRLLKKENDFDLILVSVQPFSLIKLANYLHKKTGVPYVVDFRDFLNNKYVIQKNLTTREKLINTLTIFHLNTWVKKAINISAVSGHFVNVLNNLFHKNGDVILNGYEKKYFKNCNDLFKSNNVFTIRHVGTAYKGYNFEPLVKGIQKFQQNHSEKKLIIELVGTHCVEVEEFFNRSFRSDELNIIKKRISKYEVVEKLVNSDVLILAWNLFENHYGTKVFDYLASGSHILLCPPDNSVVEELIQQHENGSVARTADEVCEIIEEQYKLWEKGQNKTKINSYPQFARENIAIDFYHKLKKLVNDK